MYLEIFIEDLAIIIDEYINYSNRPDYSKTDTIYLNNGIITDEIKCINDLHHDLHTLKISILMWAERPKSNDTIHNALYKILPNNLHTLKVYFKMNDLMFEKLPKYLYALIINGNHLELRIHKKISLFKKLPKGLNTLAIQSCPIDYRYLLDLPKSVKNLVLTDTNISNKDIHHIPQSVTNVIINGIVPKKFIRDP
jgi:hypothetical protein